MKKNTAQSVIFPILDADGDLVTGATGLDSEVSIDSGEFTDCTNEATEIATNSGMYYLTLTADETNGSCIAVIVKTSSSGAKTTPLVFYTQSTNLDAVKAETATIVADTNELQGLIADSKLPAQVKGQDNIDFGALQKASITTAANTAENLVNALQVLKGKWAISGTTLTFYASDGTTPLYTFTLDSATAPTSRTPA